MVLQRNHMKMAIGFTKKLYQNGYYKLFCFIQRNYVNTDNGYSKKLLQRNYINIAELISQTQKTGFDATRPICSQYMSHDMRFPTMWYV